MWMGWGGKVVGSAVMLRREGCVGWWDRDVCRGKGIGDEDVG